MNITFRIFYFDCICLGINNDYIGAAAIGIIVINAYLSVRGKIWIMLETPWTPPPPFDSLVTGVQNGDQMDVPKDAEFDPPDPATRSKTSSTSDPSP